MALTAQQIAQKWAQNLSRSGEAIKQGVQSVTVAPGMRAAAQAQKYADRTTEAVRSGKFQRRVSAVTLPSWQDAMINKGIPRLNSGTNAAIPKMTQFIQEAQPVWEAIKSQTANMPNNSTEDALEKVRVAITRMKDFAASRQ